MFDFDKIHSYLFPVDELEKLLAVVNSFLAHIKRASCLTARERILAAHPWVRRYFTIKQDKAMRVWRPPRDFLFLCSQYQWFRQVFAGSLLFFQVGRYYELFGDDALLARRLWRLKILPPRFKGIERAGVPLCMLRRFINRAVAAGLSVASVHETGYPLARLKERFPGELWTPMAGVMEVRL